MPALGYPAETVAGETVRRWGLPVAAPDFARPKLSCMQGIYVLTDGRVRPEAFRRAARNQQQAAHPRAADPARGEVDLRSPATDRQGEGRGRGSEEPQPYARAPGTGRCVMSRAIAMARHLLPVRQDPLARIGAAREVSGRSTRDRAYVHAVRGDQDPAVGEDGGRRDPPAGSPAARASSSVQRITFAIPRALVDLHLRVP